MSFPTSCVEETREEEFGGFWMRGANVLTSGITRKAKLRVFEEQRKEESGKEREE